MLSAIAAAFRSRNIFAAERPTTTKDTDLMKETAKHFQRYIHPAQLMVDVAGYGYSVEYAVEGLAMPSTSWTTHMWRTPS